MVEYELCLADMGLFQGKTSTIALKYMIGLDNLDEYRGYEKQARESNIGLWGSCQIQEGGTSKSTNSL